MGHAKEPLPQATLEVRRSCDRRGVQRANGSTRIKEARKEKGKRTLRGAAGPRRCGGTIDFHSTPAGPAATGCMASPAEQGQIDARRPARLDRIQVARRVARAARDRDAWD